ncbi:MAG: 30S ribosomal protein S8 [Simkania sp.]|nr:30S ribosomal protein S8 [Simkania sp.]
MSMHDPIADLLTRIRNAREARHRFVDFHVSKIKVNIIRILQEQGFIDNFLVNEEDGKGRIFLKYAQGREPVIQGLKRVSSPGLRRYVNSHKIPRVLGGMGIAIVSTSKGVMDGESARKQKLGGELLCLVW